MSWFMDLISKPYTAQHQQEVEKLIAELVQIGKRDDFLSERPGAGFNSQCRDIRARAIGKRLDEIGGLPVMEYVEKWGGREGEGASRRGQASKDLEGGLKEGEGP